MRDNCRIGSDLIVVDTMDIRGPRWALQTGFYEWQIRMAICAAAEISKRSTIDLVITIPSVTTYQEVLIVRNMYEHARNKVSLDGSKVRLGVMIENARTCLSIPHLIDLADVFCFGLNDLSQSVFSLNRSSWPYIQDYYVAKCLVDDDPFLSLDRLVVEPMLRSSIQQICKLKPEAEIIICGAASESERAIEALAEFQLSFCVDPAASISTMLLMERSRVASMIPGIRLIDFIPFAEAAKTMKRIKAAKVLKSKALPRELALQWAERRLTAEGTADIRNWKTIKKRIIGSVFGPLPGRFFPDGWKLEEVAEYSCTLLASAQETRLSIFPNTISCHSRSELLDSTAGFDHLCSLLASLDSDTTLHVFPQQASDQMCFRLFVDDRAVVLEVGRGQAMYVFENERGEHQTLTAFGLVGGEFQIDERQESDDLNAMLHLFLNRYEHWIYSVSSWVSILLGLNRWGLEGYFDPEAENLPIIVDIDLPMDLAWN